MAVDLSNVSVVQWWDDVEKHRCGYCNNTNCSISNGMWAESLTVEDYQNLIDRGWRRSGKYCYKPIMQETCCPQYTIKCDALNIRLSKSQKKVIKKFNKFLEDGVLNTKDVSTEAQYTDGQISESLISLQKQPLICLGDVQVSSTEQESVLRSKTECGTLGKKGECSTHIEEPVKPILNRPKSGADKLEVKQRSGPDPTKLPCKKAKLMRIERKKEKLLKMGLHFEKKEPALSQKSIEEFLREVSKDSKVKLRLCLVPTSEPNSEWDSVKDIEFNLYKKYQINVHNDPPEKLSMKGFHRFLVNSPLKQKQFPNGDGPGFGSFHQQYWLNDKLIAVGVIDILPKCVSSVYFFYDPDYRSLTLGTYGSLKEVELTRSLQKKLPELCNYYMGFYIHSCPKMRYKGKLSPSYLACPETYVWIPIEECIPLLDVNNYSRLNPDIDAVDEDMPSSRDLVQVKIVYDFTLMSFKSYKNVNPEAEELFTKIGLLVGKKCFSSIIFWIP